MSRNRLLVEKGDTLSRVVDWNESDGDPINLTGYTVTCNITVGEVIYNLTSVSGLTIDALNGRITITLTAVQTNAFVEQYGNWRLKATSGSGIVTTLAEGLVFVSF